MNMPGGGAPPLASKRQWWALAVLALPTMLTAMDINVLFLALPHLSESLGASSTQQLWITDIYGFLISGFLVTMGTLGDRIGRRKVLLIGATAFGILSVLAAYSTSPEMLIAVRALLGIAGATIMPSTLALIMAMFQHPKQMTAAIGVWATALMAGIAIGPVVGGLLLASFWWGSVFLLAVPVMVLVLATGPALLPEFRNPNAGRLDPLSVLLSLLTILPFIYGFKELANNGWSVVAVVGIVAGIVFGIVFVQRQRKLESPLLDVRLFTIRTVRGALTLGLVFALVQGGTGLLLTLHLQLVEGYSPLHCALLLLAPVIVMVVGIQLTRPLSQKVKPGIILTAGMIIAAIGMIVLTQVSVGGVTVLVIGASIVFLGGSPIGVLVNQLVMQASPPEKMGSAASLQSTGGELGVALGIAALGSIATAVYHGHLSFSSQVPAAAAQAAHSSIEGAVNAANGLSGSAAGSLLTTARDAFSSGLDITSLICAIAFAGLALLAYVSLRHIAIPAMPQQPPQEAGEPEIGLAQAEVTTQEDAAA